jgi:hypothetical protein
VSPKKGDASETKEGSETTTEPVTEIQETPETPEETQSQEVTTTEKSKKPTKKASGEAKETKKKGRSLGKVTVYQSLTVKELFVKHGFFRGMAVPEDYIEKLPDGETILVPVTEPDEDPLIFPGVPEATTWVHNRLKNGELPSGDYFIIRLVKKFGATVKQVVQVDMKETDF